PPSPPFPYTTLFRSNLHDAVLVEVRLERGMRVDGAEIAHPHAVELGDIRRVHPAALAEARAEQRQEPGQERRAAQVVEQHLAAQDRKSTRLNSSHVK